MEIDYLENWSVLNTHLQGLDEDTVRKLLKREMKVGKRTALLLRLYGRYNILRTDRERKEIIAGTWVG